MNIKSWNSICKHDRNEKTKGQSTQLLTSEVHGRCSDRSVGLWLLSCSGSLVSTWHCQRYFLRRKIEAQLMIVVTRCLVTNLSLKLTQSFSARPVWTHSSLEAACSLSTQAKQARARQSVHTASKAVCPNNSWLQSRPSAAACFQYAQSGNNCTDVSPDLGGHQITSRSWSWHTKTAPIPIQNFPWCLLRCKNYGRRNYGQRWGWSSPCGLHEREYDERKAWDDVQRGVFCKGCHCNHLKCQN